MSPSPRTHIYRLLLVLAAVIIGFLGLRSIAIPASWDNERFYRVDALEDLKQQPIRIGGNVACAGSTCHEGHRSATHQGRFDTLSKGAHRGLACENCHGPLSEHVKDGKKIGFAWLTVDNELCMGCHQRLLTRPEDFPQFSETLIYHKLLKVSQESACRSCHDPHEPK